MISLTYEYKLKPTPEQHDIFDQWLEVCRGVWNYALRERKDWLNSRKCDINACSLKHEYIIPFDVPKPNYASQCKALTAAKKLLPHLAVVNAQVLQQVLKQLDKAFVSMWEQGHGFPRFKKPGRMRSVVFPQLSEKPLLFDAIKLPVIGWVKMWMSRPIPQGFDLKQVRIVKRASGWYAILALQADVQILDRMPHGKAVGIDLGLEKFLATSDGDLVSRPRFFVDAQRQLKLLQQRLRHKKKGSKNWRKAQQKIARLHECISNARKDFHLKTAHQLCNSAGMVFAEKLNLKAMSRGMLSKHTLDAGWGQFLNILSWVCWKQDVYFAKVDHNYTSQTCPSCQTITGKKELNERVHSCGECGYTIDRDVAAAMVVVQRGLTAVGHTVVKTPVEGMCLGHPMKQEISKAILGIPHRSR